MGMSAEIQVCACLCQFLKLFWLMIQNNNRLTPVQILCELGGSFSFCVSFTRPGRIFAAGKIETVMDQNCVILQNLDSTFFYKIIHAGIQDMRRIRMKSKTCQNGFVQIMISPTGISTVSGFKRLKNAAQLFRMRNSFIFVIKNIACNTYKIRLFPVDFTDDFTGVKKTCAVRCV